MSTAQNIIAMALKKTMEHDKPAPNPFLRNSMQYRWWQDGVSLGMQEIGERLDRECAA